MWNKETIIIFTLFLLTLTLRIIGINFGLPDYTISDEFQLIERALQMGTGDLNPHLFTWPGHLPAYLLFVIYFIQYIIGFILNNYQTSVDMATHYLSNPTIFILSARLITAFIGSLSIVVFYYMVKGLFNDKITTITASIILILNYTHLRHSHYARPDIFATFFVILSMTLIIYALNNKNRYLMFLSGLTCGMGLASKFNTGLIIIPLLVLALSTGNTLIKKLKNMLITTSGIIFGFFLFAPFFIIDYKNAIDDILTQFSRIQSSRFGAFSNQFGYLLKILLFRKFGILLTLSAMGGFVMLFIKTNKKKLFLLLIVLITIIIAGTKRFPSHYILPVIPILSIISAYFLKSVFSLVNKAFKPIPIKNIAVVLLAIVLIQPVYMCCNMLKSFTLEDTRTIARRYIENNIESGENILIDTIMPDVESPQLYPSRQNIKYLIKYSKSKGRFKYFIEDGKYPYGKNTYNLYPRKALDDEWLSLVVKKDIGYIVISKFTDEDFFYDQIINPGDETYKGETEYHNSLAEDDRFELIKSFKPDKIFRGPEIKIYSIK
jgi:hypothetical protein